MLIEFLNACLIFFVPAIVIVCFVDREEAGAIVVARVIVWVRDKFRIIGGRQ